MIFVTLPTPMLRRDVLKDCLMSAKTLASTDHHYCYHNNNNYNNYYYYYGDDDDD